MNDLQIYYENQKKSTIVAFLLWLFFGGLGIHKFYLNRIGQGIILLLLSLSAIVIRIFVPIFWILPTIIVGVVLLVDLFYIRTMVAEENLIIYNNLIRNTQISVIPVQNNIKETKISYIKCEYCNSETPINSIFCTNCGKKFDYVFCKHCGKKIINSSTYCASCGKKVN